MTSCPQGSFSVCGSGDRAVGAGGRGKKEFAYLALVLEAGPWDISSRELTIAKRTSSAGGTL